jgi:hypothetical protein
MARLLQKYLVWIALEISPQQVIETNTEPTKTTICTYKSEVILTVRRR